MAPGTTTSTAGNWLFAIVTWTQDPTLAEAHVNVADDVHSYWRQFPASSISGKTRTTIAYTPNIARSVGNVYVAPDNEITAMNVLVVEISGLGPWDTLAGTGSNYAAAATSLSLSQTAAASNTFFIAATGGDNITSGQAFLPAGWTGLVTQTQTDGTDHLCDNILTAAFLPSSASNQSVSGISVQRGEHVRVHPRRRSRSCQPDPREPQPELALLHLRGRVRERVQHPGQ